MKRCKGFLAVMLLFFTVLSGCGGGGASGADETEVIGSDVENATELTYWTFVGLHVDFFKDAVERWNKANPDRPIKLVAETYPYDNMHNNLLLALQSGKGAPDLADIEIQRFPNYLQGDVQFVSLNDVIKPIEDQFVKARLDIYSKDGTYYGLPTHVGATVMYYNAELLDQAGVNPDEIETWDDYVEAGKKVVEATGKPMTTVETNDIWTYWSMITQRKSDFFDEEGNVTVANQDNVEVLQFISDMVHEHKISEPAPGGFHHAEEYYGFMNEGGAASVMMPMWYMGRFLDYMPDLKGKIVIRPLPSWEKGGYRSAGMGGTGTVVTKQSEHQDLAVDFLAFAKASKEGNIKLWEVLGFDPPRWDVWDSPAMKEENKYYQYFGDYIFDMLLDIRDEIYPVNITANNPKVLDYLNTNVFHNVIREQNQTPEEALKEAANQVNQ